MNWIFDKLSELQNRFFYKSEQEQPTEETAKQTAPEPDLSKLRVVDLRAMASEKNLTGISRLNKAGLIDLIKQN